MKPHHLEPTSPKLWSWTWDSGLHLFAQKHRCGVFVKQFFPPDAQCQSKNIPGHCAWLSLDVEKGRKKPLYNAVRPNFRHLPAPKVERWQGCRFTGCLFKTTERLGVFSCLFMPPFPIFLPFKKSEFSFLSWHPSHLFSLMAVAIRWHLTMPWESQGTLGFRGFSQTQIHHVSLRWWKQSRSSDLGQKSLTLNHPEIVPCLAPWESAREHCCTTK